MPPLPEPAVLGALDDSASRAAARKAAREARQEQMQFEPVTRGRFEKSEPTIVDGQDLDVPTFLRRNLKVK
jgi:cell division protein FtsZ